MRFGQIFYILGWASLCLALAMLAPLITSMWLDETIHMRNFFIGFLVTGFVAGILILSGQADYNMPVRLADMFLLAILFWSLLPLFAAIPLTGALEIDSYRQAYIEALSGLTTTGATHITVPELETTPIILWQHMLGWLGGFASLVFALTVLAPYMVGGTRRMTSTLMQYADDETMRERLSYPILIIFPFYISISLFGIFLIAANGNSLFDSLMVGMSAISTTGFTPRSDAINAFISPPAQFIIIALCFIGAMSIPVLIRANRYARKFYRDEEWLYMVLLVVILSLLAIIFLDGSVGRHIAQQVSLLSGTGFRFFTFADTIEWPMVWLFLPVIIGGMGASTTGGLKIFRLIVFLRDIHIEIRKLIFPSSIRPVKLNGREVTTDQLTAIRMFCLSYIAFLFIGILGFSLSGSVVPKAILQTLAFLNNSGAVLLMTEAHNSLVDFSFGEQLIAAFLMIAGRVEILVLVALFNPFFWNFGSRR